MPTERAPNLFLVGAQKSGTSAIAGWLGQHSQVFMSFPKEPGFLAFGEQGYPYPDGYGNPAPASRYVVNSEQAYRKLFRAAEKQHRVIGEASTWYLACPETAAKIRARYPTAKIIVILRNPVDRAHSAWCHARSDMIEPCTQFPQALALEEQRGEVEFLLRYKKMGLYSASLEQFQAVFPPAQLLLLFYDDLRRDPADTWRILCEFLGIDAHEEPDYQGQYNRTGQPRSALLQKILHSHRVKSLVRQCLPQRLALRIKAGVDSVNLDELPPMDEHCRGQLQEYYRSDIEALSGLTGRDLRAWLQ